MKCFTLGVLAACLIFPGCVSNQQKEVIYDEAVVHEEIAAEVEAPAPVEPGPEFIDYKVRKGDTLSKISRMFDVSMQELMDVNKITNKNKIYAGQTLKIPSK